MNPLTKVELTESKCCTCYDTFPSSETIRLECGDIYCTDCLKGFFIRATKDEQLFPPRCCRQNIPVSAIAAKMTTEELHVFASAEVEFSTKNRVYCSNLRCGRFIPPSRIIWNRAQCGSCQYSTCAICKNIFHYGYCPEDPGLRGTLEFASSQGWQRCFACGTVVELETGCYHIRCKCKAEFCYLCGARWKVCSCRLWDEARLRPAAFVDRNLNLPIPQPWPEPQQEYRRENVCRHPGRGRFRRVDGVGYGFVCNRCGARHWKFILECRLCQIRVCQNCRLRILVGA
ncbi:hypothetical protein BDV23DRAFT_171774 [Aspergillus alliaceus]|uniref:RBR-type E3 ubiquitin transferase n=1 Tax=Petromyces alliaceus TaxID=209559 RepID=A0A5N7CAL7_PETAA|nr:hypothetical protein BDV23DRAFT_171774 [Aspergillus alliaceus]